MDADVWYTDLITGQAHSVSTAPGDQQLTSVSQGRVVFTDWTAMDVLVFDVATGQTINLTNAAGSNALDPAISGNLVAWTDDRDGNAEIYARDLGTGEERRISNDPLVDQSPGVGAGLIVWERCDGYACDIFVYDWVAGTTRQLTASPNASEHFPQVDGRVVVFQREQGTPIDKNIVAIDLDSLGERVLDLTGDQENAHISGGFVSFNDSASGQPHIGLWDLGTGYHLEVPGGPSGEYLNAIDGNRIVYSADRSGTLDIYMYEFQVRPSISLNPQALNFGDVGTGESESLLVTISNKGSMDLTLSGVFLASGGSSAFSITQAPLTTVPPGGSTDLAVTFAPNAPGSASGTLQIASDDPLQGTVEVALDGKGVYSEVPPEQQMETILLFFDTSVADGTLQGDGPGRSAGNRLRALRNMLEAAGDLMRDGDMLGAYRQLFDAYQKTDGHQKPPDFVAGPAAAELARLIQTMMDSL